MTKADCQSLPRLGPSDTTSPAACASAQASAWLGNQISMVIWVSPRRSPWNSGSVPPRTTSVG